MSAEDVMPVGDCCVCGDQVDHREMGVCEECKGAFHWIRCGDWHRNRHTCDACKEREEAET